MHAGSCCVWWSFLQSLCSSHQQYASATVPECEQNRTHDLTSAILYSQLAQPYYPLALLLWREKIKQLLK